MADEHPFSKDPILYDTRAVLRYQFYTGLLKNTNVDYKLIPIFIDIVSKTIKILSELYHIKKCRILDFELRPKTDGCMIRFICQSIDKPRCKRRGIEVSIMKHYDSNTKRENGYIWNRVFSIYNTRKFEFTKFVTLAYWSGD